MGQSQLCGETVCWENFKHESSLQILSSRLGILAPHRCSVLRCKATLSAQHTASVGAAPGPSLSTACQWRRNLDHFAATSEIYMHFWTFIHTFPSVVFDEAYESSGQARNMKSCFHLLCLGWAGCWSLTRCFNKSVNRDFMIYTLESTLWLAVET